MITVSMGEIAEFTVKYVQLYSKSSTDLSVTFNCFKIYTDGKRNATVKICHALHVANKHELHKLTVARMLSQASGLF